MGPAVRSWPRSRQPWWTPGKRGAEEIGRLVRDVEPDVGGVVAAHGFGDGAGDDAAGGELGVGVDFGEEAVAGGVEQDSALAAEGFRDEEGGPVTADERGGVELDELEVADDRAGAEGEAEAVCGGDCGVGGVGVERAGAAGGEDGGVGGDRGVLAGRVGDDCADAAAGFECEFDGGVVFAEVDVAALDATFEGALDVQSGAVAAGVEDAGLGVSALLSERDRAVWGLGRSRRRDRSGAGRRPARPR